MRIAGPLDSLIYDLMQQVTRAFDRKPGNKTRENKEVHVSWLIQHQKYTT